MVSGRGVVSDNAGGDLLQEQGLGRVVAPQDLLHTPPKEPLFIGGAIEVVSRLVCIPEVNYPWQRHI